MAAHQSPRDGHFGKTKAKERAINRFFWPGMKEDVSEVCSRYQKATPGLIRKVSLFIPLLTMRNPFSRRAKDIIGFLPLMAQIYLNHLRLWHTVP